MYILIKELLDNKFKIVKNKINTKHTVLVSEYYLSLTSKKSKKIIEYSFKFLLNKEANTSILPFRIKCYNIIFS